MSIDTIPPEILTGLRKRLAEIERADGVTVFYACESGSRAWDFASDDSDFDVRFLYIRPRDWYLCLQDQRDVIEAPIEGIYDVNGWDVRKALLLGAKSNPVLFEWLSSPIRYVEQPLAARFGEVVRACFDPAKAYHHYLSMARNQRRAYLRASTVRHKKYFYVLRPLLACDFLLDQGRTIPMRFGDLMKAVAVPRPVVDAIEVMLETKRAMKELDRGDRIPVLDQWIDEQIRRLERLTPDTGRVPNWARLNEFFISALAENP